VEHFAVLSCPNAEYAMLCTVGFCSASFFRWTADASVIVAALSAWFTSKQRLASAQKGNMRFSSFAPGSAALWAPLLEQRGGRDSTREDRAARWGANPKKKSAASKITVVLGPKAATVAFGLVMTLPWARVRTPEQMSFPHLPYLFMWLPSLHSSQPLVYGVVSAAGAIALLMLAGSIMVGAGQAKEAMESATKSKWKKLPLRRAHSYMLRLQCFLFLYATRMALEAAICFALIGQADASGLTGAVALVCTST
jgi:hypothetical protein